MCLKLSSKICQISFAGRYNRKTDFVERVQAEENHVFAKHRPFSSTIAHRNSTLGPRENMECVADEIGRCIRQGSFAVSSHTCYTGVTREKSNFNRFLLSLCKARRLDYTPLKCKSLDRMHFIWQVYNNNLK